MLTSLLVLVAVGVVVAYLQRRVGSDEAVRTARESAVLIGRGIIGPVLTEGAVRGEPDALAAVDRTVRERVLDDQIVRIKVWAEDGRIIYSDRRELVGQVFPLDADGRRLQPGEASAEISDLDGPDNVYEREFGRLLEVYYPLEVGGGTRVFVESYERYDGVAGDAGRIWRTLAPILVAALLLLWLAQAPVAWSMARRLRRGQTERELLLRHAVDASTAERQRIAADLHDGVVQRLAGTAYGLAATTERLRAADENEAAEALDESILTVRQSLRELRTLIVAIYPPILAAEGLEPALRDLIAPLSEKRIDAKIDMDANLRSSPEVEKLLFRGAQEALRNVLSHADAQTVVVSVSRDGERTTLTVDDDGRGIAGDDPRSPEDGHLGLALLAELASRMGGSVHVGPSPTGGTRMLLEVPRS